MAKKTQTLDIAQNLKKDIPIAGTQFNVRIEDNWLTSGLARSRLTLEMDRLGLIVTGVFLLFYVKKFRRQYAIVRTKESLRLLIDATPKAREVAIS